MVDRSGKVVSTGALNNSLTFGLSLDQDDSFLMKSHYKLSESFIK